jgi:hypothetical protein
MFLEIFPSIGVRTTFPLMAKGTIHIFRRHEGLLADEGCKFSPRAQ